MQCACTSRVSGPKWTANHIQSLTALIVGILYWLPTSPPFLFIYNGWDRACLRLPILSTHAYPSSGTLPGRRAPVLGCYGVGSVLPVFDYRSSILSHIWGEVPASGAIMAWTMRCYCHWLRRTWPHTQRNISTLAVIKRTAMAPSPAHCLRNETDCCNIFFHSLTGAIVTLVEYMNIIWAHNYLVKFWNWWFQVPLSIFPNCLERLAAKDKLLWAIGVIQSPAILCMHPNWHNWL